MKPPIEQREILTGELEPLLKRWRSRSEVISTNWKNNTEGNNQRDREGE